MESYIFDKIEKESLTDLYTSPQPHKAKKLTWHNIGMGITLATALNASVSDSYALSSKPVDFHYASQPIHKSEIDKNYTTVGDSNSELKLILTPSYIFSKAFQQNLEQDAKSYLKDQRYKSLYRSFIKNCSSKYPKERNDIAINLFNTISSISFKDLIVQYNTYEECIDISLFLDKYIEISIGRFIDEESDNVVFSIYNNNDLLVSDEMKTKDFVRKILNIESKLNSNA